MKILMVGCGKMGGALLKHWSNGSVGQFTVLDPATPTIDGNFTHVASRDELGDERFDLLILAIKPQQIDKIAGDYTEYLSSAAAIVSIAAGYSLERLATIFQDKQIIRLMPNLPAAIGKASCGLVANSQCGSAIKNFMEDLVKPVGDYLWIEDEDQLDRFTAVAGSGPGYVFQFMQSYLESARSLGFSEDEARKMVVQTVSGAADMAAQSDLPISELKAAVVSKNGTTHHGLSALNKDGLLDTLITNTVEAAYARAVELR